MDHATLRFMINHRADWPTTVMQGINSLGSALVLVPIAGLNASLWRWKRHDWQAA